MTADIRQNLIALDHLSRDVRGEIDRTIVLFNRHGQLNREDWDRLSSIIGQLVDQRDEISGILISESAAGYAGASKLDAAKIAISNAAEDLARLSDSERVKKQPVALKDLQQVLVALRLDLGELYELQADMLNVAMSLMDKVAEMADAPQESIDRHRGAIKHDIDLKEVRAAIWKEIVTPLLVEVEKRRDLIGGK